MYLCVYSCMFLNKSWTIWFTEAIEKDFCSQCLSLNVLVLVHQTAGLFIKIWYGYLAYYSVAILDEKKVI